MERLLCPGRPSSHLEGARGETRSAIPKEAAPLRSAQGSQRCSLLATLILCRDCDGVPSIGELVLRAAAHRRSERFQTIILLIISEYINEPAGPVACRRPRCAVRYAHHVAEGTCVGSRRDSRLHQPRERDGRSAPLRRRRLRGRKHRRSDPETAIQVTVAVLARSARLSPKTS